MDYTLVLLDNPAPDVRVTVIAANGPSFCGGYDLTQNGRTITAPSPD